MSPERGGTILSREFHRTQQSIFRGYVSFEQAIPSLISLKRNCSWWLNQPPFEKICSAIWIISPSFGVTIFLLKPPTKFRKNMLENSVNVARFNPSMHLSASNLQIYSFSSPMCLQETPEGISSFCCRVPPSIRLCLVLTTSSSI